MVDIDTIKSPSGRTVQSPASVADTVKGVIADVRERGDVAVREYSEKFDNWSPESFKLSDARVAEIIKTVPDTVIDDIKTAQANVRFFAQQQRESLHDFEVETQPGVLLGQKNIPVSVSGAYVPGGRYPLVASAHMTIVTAKVAGVEHVTACTPPIRGEIPAATVAAMHLAGADEIFLLGGVQAVTAMALGTETFTKVDILCGPGNAFVAEAKRQLFGQVGIDLFAGPTEILVVADEDADPFVVAVDLLSQAEHGPDSPAILITTSATLAAQVISYIEQLLPGMPTNDFAEPAWRDHGQVHVVNGSIEDAYAFADSFAAEHVEILTAEPRRAGHHMCNAGDLGGHDRHVRGRHEWVAAAGDVGTDDTDRDVLLPQQHAGLRLDLEVVDRLALLLGEETDVGLGGLDVVDDGVGHRLDDVGDLGVTELEALR
jgi:sulfopropanediol 3-dehydrogenase